MKKEGKNELKERFIELRSAGRSFADIATTLNVSKPTLIAWSKELKKEIANARTLRLDLLFEKFAVGKAKRIEIFGERLNSILAELDSRDLHDVPTPTLMKLALEYGTKLKAEEADLVILGDEQDSMMAVCASMFTTETWEI